VAYYKTQGKTVFNVLAEIYQRFGFYKEALISVTKKGKDGAEQIQELMNQYRTSPPLEMNGSAVEMIYDVKNASIHYPKTQKVETLDLDKSNVMQFYLADGSKISARPSGTEPKIKYYFSVNTSITNTDDYSRIEKVLLDKLEGLKKYFS
jgi:phosphoglucomutase